MAAISIPIPLSDDRPLAGMALCVAGLFLFSLQDIVIKHFSGTYSVLQIVFIRGVVAIVPILLVVRATRGWRGIRTGKPKLLLLRGCLSFCSYLAYYMAIAALPLVDVVTIVFSAPIMVTVLSAILLKEAVGLRRWLALLVGFFALVIVVGPSGDFGHLATGLALLAALTYACQNLLTRIIGVSEHPWTITFYSMLAFVIGGAVAGALVWAFAGTDGSAGIAEYNPALQFLLRPWVMPPLEHFLLMAFVGVNGALAFYLMIKAYAFAPVSLVAPFEYTYIIWAVLFGYLIWAEVPRAHSIIGVALLVASGFYIFRRELKLSKRAASGASRTPLIAPKAYPRFRASAHFR